MKPRILIVGTVPYNKRSTSRAFESYFYNWEKENLAQIFSNTKQPAKGHCETLFQITDQRLLKKRINKSIDTGIIFHYNELPNEWKDNALEVNSSLFSWLYKIGSKKLPIIYLLRKLIWKKSFWCTEKLNNWLDEFNPKCVFLSFSDDFFIQEIALYVAKRFNIPIISSIGDDYFFDSKFSLSPFYFIYKISYRNLIKRVFKHQGSAIYIGDKIRDKYNSYFKLTGETVYLTSDIKTNNFKVIDKKYPKIIYGGNIRLGRNTSLIDIANALGKINPNYVLRVYSNENDRRYYSLFKKNPNICYLGSISYKELEREILDSDILIIVEGFKKNHTRITRYSLSTKVADSLASGNCIFAYGSLDCGAIEYLSMTNSAVVCTRKKELENCLKELINNEEIQLSKYNNARNTYTKNHLIHRNTHIFENLVNKIIKG